MAFSPLHGLCETMDTTFAPSCLVSRLAHHKVALFEADSAASKSLSSKQVLYVDLYH